ncbi:TPA: hypothetical protein MYO72_005756 [Citrobacter freundii]|nr:hypothetical protein [Citrobacter freundii]HCB1509013.1 hypothetical protein [Citrobacter freundii]HCB1519835.1 hypothetical protein [Citrobacter freundii]HCB1520145.1 hypothetical protein [Citrobacter freundii]
MKNALIINAHQRWENFAEGKLNQSFASVAEDRLTMLGYNVQTTVRCFAVRTNFGQQQDCFFS